MLRFFEISNIGSCIIEFLTYGEYTMIKPYLTKHSSHYETVANNTSDNTLCKNLGKDVIEKSKNKQYYLSNPLCDFFRIKYGTKSSPNDCYLRLFKYISANRAKNLKNPENGSHIILTDALKTIIKEPEDGKPLTYFNLQRQTKHNYMTKEEYEEYKKNRYRYKIIGE